jgi:hypothetical protein
MLFRKTLFSAYHENCTKHINTLTEYNAEFFNPEAGGTYSYDAA